MTLPFTEALRFFHINVIDYVFYYNGFAFDVFIFINLAILINLDILIKIIIKSSSKITNLIRNCKFNQKLKI